MYHWRRINPSIEKRQCVHVEHSSRESEPCPPLFGGERGQISYKPGRACTTDPGFPGGLIFLEATPCRVAQQVTKYRAFFYSWFILRILVYLVIYDSG